MFKAYSKSKDRGKEWKTQPSYFEVILEEQKM